MGAYEDWLSEPPEPDEPDEFEKFCAAFQIPHTEQSWVEFEEFIAPGGPLDQVVSSW